MSGEGAGREKWFLSHAGSDRAAAERVARGLREAGVDVWCDVVPGSLPAGRPWIEELEAALRKCTGYVLLVPPAGISRWVRAELDAALILQMDRPEYRLSAVLRPGATVEQLPLFLRRFQAVPFGADLAQATDADLRELATRLGAPPERAVAADVCPFPGLESFDEESRAFYFGRDDDVRRACALLGATDHGHVRWLQIHGPSGAGKSSLARAGIVPAVRRGNVRGSFRDWVVAVFRPGADPLFSMAEAVAEALSGTGARIEAKGVLGAIRDPDQGVGRFLKEQTPKLHGFLLVADQLEEAFTLAPAPERVRFDAALAEFVRGDGSLYLVTTIRSDFLGRFHELPKLAAALRAGEASSLYVPPLDAKGREQAIRGPAERAGLQWQDGLSERLLADAEEAERGQGIAAERPATAQGKPAAEPESKRSGDSLPLLAHVLLELWKQRERNELTHTAYDALGRLDGALAKSAGRVIEGLGKEDGERAMALLVQLVKVGTDSEPTRAPTSRGHALSLLGGGERAERILACLSGGRAPNEPAAVSANEQVRVRLVTVGGDAGEAAAVPSGAADAQDERRVDLVHEGLIRRWHDLASRVKLAEEDLRKRDRLDETARIWTAEGANPDELPRGSALAKFERVPNPTARSVAFLTAAREAQKERNCRGWLWAAGIAAVAAVGVGAWCWMKGDDWTVDEWRDRAEQAANLERRYATEFADPVAKPDAALNWVEEARELVNALADPPSSEVKTRTVGFVARVEAFRDGSEWGNAAASEYTSLQGWKEWWPDGASVAAAIQSDSRFGADVATALARDVESGALIPLGRDPSSRLFEFALPLTGLVPPRVNGDGCDKLVRPSVGAIVLVLVPGGEFTMGSTDREADDRERPVHLVTVPAFLLAKHECTEAQWARLDGDAAPDLSASDDLRLPVVDVRWTKVHDRLLARRLRLPSEAEWEYACRAGTTTVYGFGDDEKRLADHGWYNQNSDKRTHPVGAKLANAFGLHDMHGNVWEWCEDPWHDDYKGAPSNGSPWTGNDAWSYRVVRGGSWALEARDARSACRYRSDTRDRALGFRPARSVTP